MRRIVKKTAQGTYSCFCLDPDKLNELLSAPQGESLPTSLKSDVGSQNKSEPGASALKSTVAPKIEGESLPMSLKSDVGSQKRGETRASALKSTVASKTGGESVPMSLKSDVGRPKLDIDLPMSLKSDMGSEMAPENSPMSPKSDVAMSLKSDVLLVNSSPNLHPSTKKIPAVAVRTTLFELDNTLVLDAEFYPAAADFLHAHSLGEDYLRWFYQHLSSSKHIQNLPGYFFKVFFKTVYVERYKAWREAHPDKIKSGSAQEYTCPVCGFIQEVTTASSSCDRCETPVNPTEKEIARYAVFYRMDTTTRERYISDRSRIFSSGGNVSEKMLILDQQYGIVS
jgi:hypothetical protein